MIALHLDTAGERRRHGATVWANGWDRRGNPAGEAARDRRGMVGWWQGVRERVDQ